MERLISTPVEKNIPVLCGWGALKSSAKDSHIPSPNVIPAGKVPTMSASDYIHFACENIARKASKKGISLLNDAVACFEAGENPKNIEASVWESIRHLDFAIEMSEATTEATTKKMRTQEVALFYHTRGFSGLFLNQINPRFILKSTVSDLEKSIKLNQKQPISHVLLAYAYWIKGRGLDAIASCETAINLDPTYAFAYHAKGQFHQKRGEEDLAHENIYWAITLNPDDFYEEKFEPILKAEREAEAYFDDLELQPEFKSEMQERLKNL